MNIRLFITGGTLDKIYNPLTGELIFGETHIPAMLARARCTNSTIISTLFLKDSLHMTDKERSTIVTACEAAEEDHIVITHGTDNMVQTAKAINANIGIAKKTIILTGAMVPYSMGEQSDALFNLGTALAYAQSLAPGVYVAMNGQYFLPDKVFKDTTVGLFKPLS
jgi:L-asparaginase